MSSYGHEFPEWGSRCVHCGRLDPDHGECPARLRAALDDARRERDEARLNLAAEVGRLREALDWYAAHEPE